MMATLLYPIIAEWDDEARAWSLLSPDFPEIASVAKPDDDVGQQASDALLTAMEARREDGDPMPMPTDKAWLLTKDWVQPTRNMLLFVAVLAELSPTNPFA